LLTLLRFYRAAASPPSEAGIILKLC